jgi:hypothetical protein
VRKPAVHTPSSMSAALVSIVSGFSASDDGAKAAAAAAASSSLSGSSSSEQLAPIAPPAGPSLALYSDAALWLGLERMHTQTLFYLAQVHGGLKNLDEVCLPLTPLEFAPPCIRLMCLMLHSPPNTATPA